MTLRPVNPPDWAPPKGYANGMVATGRTLHVAGQIGGGADFLAQFGAALDNVIAVVRAAGGAPDQIASMTVYVTDIDAYRNGLRELGPVWRARMGKHYPAMALVAVAALVSPSAMVEIQAIAHLPEETP